MSLEEALSKLHDVLRALIGESADEWTLQKQSTNFASDFEWARHLLSVHRDYCHNDCCRLKNHNQKNSSKYTEPPQYAVVYPTTRVPIQNTATSSPRQRITKLLQKRGNSRVKSQAKRNFHQTGLRVADSVTAHPKVPMNQPQPAAVHVKQEAVSIEEENEDDDVMIIPDGDPTVTKVNDTSNLSQEAPQEEVQEAPQDTWEETHGFMPDAETYNSGWEYDDGQTSAVDGSSLEQLNTDCSIVNVKTEDESAFYAENESGDTYEVTADTQGDGIVEQIDDRGNKLRLETTRAISPSHYTPLAECVPYPYTNHRATLSTVAIRDHFQARKSDFETNSVPEVFTDVGKSSAENLSYQRNDYWLSESTIDQSMAQSYSNSSLNHSAFACTFCGKRFLHHCQLKIHIRVHTGEKPHACSFCPASFAQKNNLIRHIRAKHAALFGTVNNFPYPPSQPS